MRISASAKELSCCIAKIQCQDLKLHGIANLAQKQLGAAESSVPIRNTPGNAHAPARGDKR